MVADDDEVAARALMWAANSCWGVAPAAASPASSDEGDVGGAALGLDCWRW